MPKAVLSWCCLRLVPKLCEGCAEGCAEGELLVVVGWPVGGMGITGWGRRLSARLSRRLCRRFTGWLGTWLSRGFARGNTPEGTPDGKCCISVGCALGMELG